MGDFWFRFDVMSLMFSFVFVLFLVVFVVALFRSFRTWSSNNKSPQLSVDALVVSKRMSVSRSHHHPNNSTTAVHSSSSTYYVTFEVESGDRVEFVVNPSDYGLMVEKDRGKLTFQGTRFLKFDRHRTNESEQRW